MSKFPTNQEGFFIKLTDLPFVIDVESDNSLPGASLVLKRQKVSDSQLWISDGEHITNKMTGLALTGRTPVSPASSVVQAMLSEDSNQKFSVENGVIFLSSDRNAALGVEGVPAENSKVNLGGKPQQWQLIPVQN